MTNTLSNTYIMGKLFVTVVAFTNRFKTDLSYLYKDHSGLFGAET